MVIKSIKNSLYKMRGHLRSQLEKIIPETGILTPELMQELEAALIQADIGIETTDKILQYIKNQKNIGRKDIFSIVRRYLLEILNEQPLVKLNENTSGPTIILILGVNGSGKTTTIAKLAYRFKQSGKNILMAAADTFRAAAIEQLEIWAQKLGIDVIKHSYGADPSAVSYDAVDAAINRNMDYLLIDTAGRFHTKIDLVEQLKKINRTINKRCPGAPHEKLLIIDGQTGQNSLLQAQKFNEALGITGIIVTKLDGTAKGGALISIQKKLKVPVKFIGTGQELNTLEKFNPSAYAEAII